MPVNAAHAPDDVGDQSFGHAFAAKFLPHIDAPDGAFVAELVMLLTIKPCDAGKLSVFEAAYDEVFRAACAKEGSNFFDRLAAMLIRRFGERSGISGQTKQAEVPPGLSVVIR